MLFCYTIGEPGGLMLHLRYRMNVLRFMAKKEEAMYILLGTLIGFLIVMPTLVLLHELGHAMVHLIIGEKVCVTLGNGQSFINIDLGNLKLIISPFSLNVGFCYWDYQPSFIAEVISFASGPIVSLCCCVACYLLGLSHPMGLKKYILDFAMWFCLFQFVLTAVPIKYPGFMYGYSGLPNDGYQLYKLFIGRGLML